MATQVFTSSDAVRKYSVISGNMDSDRIKQYILRAQEKYVEHTLGTDLYDRIQAGITAADLNADETALLNDFIEPMTRYWAIVETLKEAAYTVSNNGVFKHTSENAETVERDELLYMVENYKSDAERYQKRFVDFMCYNDDKFPEYDSNEDEDLRPSKRSFESGWAI